MDVQVQGVADALGLATRHIHVKPTKPWRWMAPWGPVNPAEGFGAPASPFAPPWPDFVLGTGRHAIPYLRAVGRHAGPATFRIVLQDPKTGPGVADLIWVPEHDTRRGANVITTPTAPHSFTADRLKGLRADLPAALERLPQPRVAIVVGGPNSVYPFQHADQERLAAALEASIARAGSLMVTPSRRTPDALIDRLLRITASARAAGRCDFWDPRGDAPNPYAHYLAAADALVVTGDSVNMCGEAAATGRPVHVFEPVGGSAKFARFHANLRATGAVRAFSAETDLAATWAYEPVFAADTIADAVEAAWLARDTGRAAG